MSSICLKTAASDCAQTLHNKKPTAVHLGQLWLFRAFFSSRQSGRLWPRMIVHQIMQRLPQISCKRNMCGPLCWMFPQGIQWGFGSEKTPWKVLVLLDVLKAGQLWFGCRCWLEQGGLKTVQYVNWKLICSIRSFSFCEFASRKEVGMF